MTNVYSDLTDAKYLDATECGTCGERLDYGCDELAEVGEVIQIGIEPEIEYSVMHADCAIEAMRTNANLELA